MTGHTNLASTQEPAGEIAPAQSGYSTLMSVAGYILAVSYPLLALSTGTRALYQLFFKEGVDANLPAILSLVAASCYLVATIGFAYRRKWTWWLSIIALGVETLLTLIVGTWSLLNPDLIGSTVWRHFGADYGYFPLFQPIIGLLWLIWPATMVMYGIRPAPASTRPTPPPLPPAQAPPPSDHPAP
jgi:hypothetical protein